MDPSRKETEVKLRFDSYAAAVERITGAGASLLEERTFEDNAVFDTPDGSLKDAHRLLRLRRYGDRAYLTFKDAVPGASRHKVREEFETEIADFDAVQITFERLGFELAYRYQKYRTRYRAGAVEVSVDETPIGCFVELEGPPDAIDELAAAIGFSPDAYVLETYRDLQVEAAGGGTPGDMLMPESGARTDGTG